MSRKLIDIKDLTISYNGTRALTDINLEIFSDDFIGMIGPNGGGKTTLVKAILGLLNPTSGEIIRTFSHAGSAQIGYLPQVQKIDYKFPITVKEVVSSGISGSSLLNRQSKKAVWSKVKSTLEDLGIAKLADKAIGSLSGGELQRVMLCRSIISDPELLILDEPSTFVDNKFERDMYKKLKELSARMAIILVSHDIGTISYYIKSIACVNKNLHYHKSNIISEEQLAAYDCPLQIVTHGHLPHTVLKEHES